MDIDKIADLKVNVNKRLNESEKKKLIEILNSEFNNQRTIYSQQIETQKEKVIADYCKSVGYDKLTKRLEKAEIELTQSKEAFEKAGLRTDGNLLDEYNISKISDAAIRDKIKTAHKAINAVNESKAFSLQNKIITRLLLCETAGEALVIMREVLGNGVLPTLTQAQLEHKP